MTLKIGSISLRDFETPSTVKFGGTQRIAVHRLANGRRVLDALGREESDITFSGVLSGSDAEARVQALDLLRTTGQRTSLQWSSFHFDVIVRQFSIEFQSPHWIPYQLVCAVLEQSIDDSASNLTAGPETLLGDLDALDALHRGSSVKLRELVDQMNRSMAAGAILGVRRLRDGLVDKIAGSIAQELQALESVVLEVGYSLSAENQAPLARLLAKLALSRAYICRIKSAVAGG